MNNERLLILCYPERFCKSERIIKKFTTKLFVFIRTERAFNKCYTQQVSEKGFLQKVISVFLKVHKNKNKLLLILSSLLSVLYQRRR